MSSKFNTKEFLAKALAIDFDPTSILDLFLEELKVSQDGAKLYLKNGICLRGTVVAHDKEVVLLLKDSAYQLLSKHAISTFSYGNAP